MGVATTRAPNDLGSPNPAKMMAQCVEFLGQPLSRNHAFEIFKGVPSPLSLLITKNSIINIRLAYNLLNQV